MNYYIVFSFCWLSATAHGTLWSNCYEQRDPRPFATLEQCLAAIPSANLATQLDDEGRAGMAYHCRLIRDER